MEIIKTAIYSSLDGPDKWSQAFGGQADFFVLRVNASNAKEKGLETFSKLRAFIGRSGLKGENKVRNIVDFISFSSQGAEVCVLSLEENILHIGISGGFTVYLSREGKTGIVGRGKGVFQGSVRQKDRVFICSSDLSLNFSEAELEKIFSFCASERSEEELALFLSSRRELEGDTVCVLELGEKMHNGQLQASGKANESKTAYSVKERLKSKLQDLQNRLSSFQTQEEDDIHIPQNKSKQVLLSIAVLLSILLFSSVFINIQKNSTRETREKALATESLVKAQLDEARGIIDLNPVEARALLTSAKLELNKVMADLPQKSREYESLSDLLAKVTTEELAAYRIYKVTNPSLFYDLTLLKDEAKGKNIAGYLENKAILDTQNGVIYYLDTSNKQGRILAGQSDVGTAGSIALHGDEVFFSNNAGIYKIEIKSGRVTKLFTKGEDDSVMDFIASYAGNIYLLDKGKNMIWKHIRTDSGFSSRVRYLNQGVSPNLADVSGMTIDGFIWVYSGGSVLKFERGNNSPFEFKGFDERLTSINSISSDDRSKNIYILDRDSMRVVVFDKEGVYQAQYQWDGLKDADDIIASEKEGKIFVLSSNRIYAIEIM